MWSSRHQTATCSRDATVTERKSFGCSRNGCGIKYGEIRADLRAVVYAVSSLSSGLSLSKEGAYIVP